jgi:1-acyl-sn-glycerol-3-phosphate acyltransferase
MASFERDVRVFYKESSCWLTGPFMVMSARPVSLFESREAAAFGRERGHQCSGEDGLPRGNPRILRPLALELGGPRALHAVTPTASFERDVGLGSLERVEFLLRLESALGRELPDRFLLLDTPRGRLSVGRRVMLLRAAMLEKLRPGVARVRRALYAVYLGVAWLAVITPHVLVAWALVALLPSRRLAFRLSRVGARALLRLVGCRISVEGREHLGTGGPLIIVANHASYTDVLALLAAVPMDFVFVAKREVLTWPLVGTFVRRQRHPTVRRWDPQESVADAQAVADRVRGGEAVLFFPEGRFIPATGLRPFRLGAFEAAVETGARVVPVALRGTRRCAAVPGCRGPVRFACWIGPAISPPGTDWSAALELRDKVVEAIAAHCGEPRLALVAGGPERP